MVQPLSWYWPHIAMNRTVPDPKTQAMTAIHETPQSMMPSATLRRATAADSERLESIRERAFTPVFASFRALLGDSIYEIAQSPSDAAQAGLLTELIRGRPGWELWVAELTAESAAPVVAGFVAFGIDPQQLTGEIGLNAVDPAFANRGLGTLMYEFCLQRMRLAGLKVAVVATGGDPSHAPARRAYRKAGFDREIPSVWMCQSLQPASDAE